MSHATSGYAGKDFIAKGKISSANITGTASGKLGHANGFILVPAFGADKVVELVSAIIINEFDTAAYAGGGNTTINISAGGSAVTGLAGASDIITVAADAIVQFVPLAATKIVLTANRGLALVTASAPTNPGTAAGVIHYRVTYRIHDTLL